MNTQGLWCYSKKLLDGPMCPDLRYLISVVDLLATCAEVSHSSEDGYRFRSETNQLATNTYFEMCNLYYYSFLICLSLVAVYMTQFCSIVSGDILNSSYRQPGVQLIAWPRQWS